MMMIKSHRNQEELKTASSTSANNSTHHHAGRQRIRVFHDCCLFLIVLCSTFHYGTCNHSSHSSSRSSSSSSDDEDGNQNKRIVATGFTDRNNYQIPSNVDTPDDSLFGGITGLTYDKSKDVYYALSNGKYDFIRVYTMTIKRSNGKTRIKKVSYLKDENNNFLSTPNDIRVRGITYHDNRLYIAHGAGTTTSGRGDGIWQYDLDGTKLNELPLPAEISSTSNDYDYGDDDYNYSNRNGNNQQQNREQGYYSITVSPTGDTLYAATKNGLLNDCYDCVRIIEYKIVSPNTFNILGQYAYKLDADFLYDIVMLDSTGSFLALEDDGSLYYASLHDATDVSGTIIRQQSDSDSESDDYFFSSSMITTKSLYAGVSSNSNYNIVNSHSNNINNMNNDENINNKNRINNYNNDNNDRLTLAKKDKLRKFDQDSNYRAIAFEYESFSSSDDFDFFMMADNDYDGSTNLFYGEIATTNEIEIVRPVKETETYSNGNAEYMTRDPAVWVNPEKSALSLIIGTHGSGGVGVYNLNGELLNAIEGGDYHSVDIIYAFNFEEGNVIDVAVVTTAEGNNGSIKTFAIVDVFPYLIDLTNNGGFIPTGGKGRNALDVATYVSVYSGKKYAFVVTDNDQIVQLELQGSISKNITKSTSFRRKLNVATKEESVVEGLAVDRETGHVYVTLSDRIIKFDAEPNEDDGDSYYEVVKASSFVKTSSTSPPPKLKGITIYYSGYKKDGYLIVSVQGESTFAVFERHDDNDYHGSFTIGDNNGSGGIGAYVDRTGETEGIDVINVNLGPDFECGTFIAHDNENTDSEGGNTMNNGNFKLVAYDVIAKSLEDHLSINSEAWSPRRFALAGWIDTLSISVYNELKRNSISGRDSQLLLGYLAEASYHLYPPATKLRQIMTPLYRVRDKPTGARSSSSGSDSKSYSSDADSSSSSSSNDDDSGHYYFGGYKKSGRSGEDAVISDDDGNDGRRTRTLYHKCNKEDSSNSVNQRNKENKAAKEAIDNFTSKLTNLDQDGRLSFISSSVITYWGELASSVGIYIPAEVSYS